MYKILFVCLLGLACNPVKRVLRDPVKTQVVVDAYLKNMPPVQAPPPVLVTGKTDTLINTILDTLYIKGADSLIRVEVREIKEKLIYRTDTVYQADLRLSASFQRQAIAEMTAKDQAIKERDEALRERSKWKTYFWSLVAAIGIGVVLYILLIIKSKSNV